VSAFFEILGFAFFLFWLLLIARIVVEFTRSSAGIGIPGASRSSSLR